VKRVARALKAEFEESIWDHLAGTVSAPFVDLGVALLRTSHQTLRHSVAFRAAP
jgi:hypothetical protein